MKKSNVLFNSIIILTIIFSEDLYAQKITILTEHLAPFQVVNEKSISGISTEIVEATLKEANYEYEIAAYPWSLSFNRAKHEKNTCIYSLSRIPEREPLFEWVGHIISSTISLYSLASKQISINNLNDAKKYKTAVIRDDVTHHFLLSKGFIENENLYVMDNYDSLLKLLEIPNRNIDLVVLNDDLIYNRVKSTEAASKYKNVYNMRELTLNFHLACSLSTEKNIIAKLTKSMKKLEQDGDFSVIRKKWRSTMMNMLD
jgi:polar amino acid transport system substrate-binding protein